MTTPTISRIIDELIEEGWVTDCGPGSSIGGKRPHIFSLNPDASYILGVDVGREQLRVVIFNLRNEIIGDIKEYPSILEKGKSNEENLSYISEKVEDALRDMGIPKEKIKVAGFAIPGLIDNDGTSSTYFVYPKTNVRQELEKLLGVPVFIDNDSQTVALAEHAFGVAQGVTDALCISINECIGMGMILNGNPYTGFRGMAGEFGHIRISGLEGRCYCGKVGCLETVASGRAIVKKAAEAVKSGTATLISTLSEGKDITLGTVIAAAKQDDIFAIDLLQKAGEKIGEGISTLIHLFNPQMIVIGGEIAESGDLIITPIQQILNKYTLVRLRKQCEIRLSDLGKNAAIRGTLMVVMKNLYYDTERHFSLY